MTIKNVTVFDKKVLTPDDKVKTSGISKSIIGRPKIYNLKTGELIADEENLVVLQGREFLAQKLSGLANAVTDLRKYEIRYFGLGSGGASGTTTSDPQDTDTSLAEPVKISETGINTSANDYQYISDGYLKKIESDNGSINIVQETFEVNDDNDTTVQKYTTIKFVMIVREDEPASKPFTFNEAGLYAVEYDDDGNLTGNTLLVARFTTTDKNLGPSDGLRIEWSILV